MTKLSIVLHRDLETGEWYIERLETEKNNIRTQTRFGVPYPIRIAFKAEFADYLLSVLPNTLSPSAAVFERQDVPALALSFSKLRVIAQRALAGLQSVTIRAQDVVGTISGVFSTNLLIEAPGYSPSPAQLEHR